MLKSLKSSTITSMVWRKTAVTPVLMHWSYHRLEPSLIKQTGVRIPFSNFEYGDTDCHKIISYQKIFIKIVINMILYLIRTLPVLLKFHTVDVSHSANDCIALKWKLGCHWLKYLEMHIILLSDNRMPWLYFSKFATSPSGQSYMRTLLLQYN